MTRSMSGLCQTVVAGSKHNAGVQLSQVALLGRVMTLDARSFGARWLDARDPLLAVA